MVKRALLIGINYFGTSSELAGCHNDVDNMRRLLVELFDFTPGQIRVMKDAADDPNNRRSSAPTRRNIISALTRLVRITKPGDELFIHYSGHGTWTYDANNDESDNRDELICPVDNKYIKDDELHVILVKDFPNGAKLRCIFDCCHSATMLDLPCRWRYRNKSYDENADPRVVARDCIMLSGCRDDQTSADAWIKEDGKPGDYAGAMTWAFEDSIRDICQKNKARINDLSWKDLVYNIRYRLKMGGYDQLPQLSFCNHDQLALQVDI